LPARRGLLRLEQAVSWVEIVSGEHGEGNGLIAFSVAPNDTLHARSAVIVVETEMVTITQSAEHSTVPAKLRAPGRSARIAGPH
jgi:hypothetical protein